MSASMVLGGGGTGEAIPRDYHRRVLKKIAQLTKVVYALNTRNEEHESTIAVLQAMYEARAKQAESSAAAKLKEMGETVRGACEEGEMRVGEARRRLEEEKEQLIQKQASHTRETEELLGTLQREHKQKMEGLVKELEQVSLQQARQLRDIAQLREQAKTSLEQRERELTERHERELRTAEEDKRTQIERSRLEAKKEIEKEAKNLKDRHRTELEAMSLSLRGEKKEREAADMRRWEEREKAVWDQLEQKERSLAERVSVLSDELRTARDQLAVARQKATDMRSLLETAEGEVCGLQGQLELGCRKREGLEEQIATLQTNVEAMREEDRKLREKLSEKEAAIDASARMEAGHHQTVSGLQSQLLALQERVAGLEREKETLAIQHSSSIQQHSHSLSSSEKELSRLHKEREELRAQYAREIEAAHAQIGVKEVELSTQHSSQLQQLREQREKELLALRSECERMLEQLRCDIKTESEQERQSLCTRHRSEVETLRRELAEREDKLRQLTAELTAALTAMEERRRGLGEVESEVEKLREEGRTMTEKERAARRETELLKNSLEKLRSEGTRNEERHKRELAQMRDEVYTHTQAECMETMRRELESLRRRLCESHAQSTEQALATLAQEKYVAFSEAKCNWSREQSSLRERIVVLERRIVEIQESSSHSLEEGRQQAERQITELREAVEREKQACVGHIQELERTHCEDVERVRREERERGGEEIQRRSEEWHREAQHREMRYCDEVRTVREEEEREKRELVSREQATHRDQMASLQSSLEEQHRKEMERLQREREGERGAWDYEKQQLETQREQEVSEYRNQLEQLKEEGERKSRELTHSRDTLTSISEEAAILRKQLQVRGQELLVAKREASNVLRCREQELNSSHHAEVESMASQYRQQTQLLLTDFNKAKKMMTSKISQLQRKVSELELLYESRQSRPEDLEMIRGLQREVKHYKIRVREIEAEKQVYQLELVNREKNYNQIFSASPCVGVLDPLSSGKKKLQKPPAESSSRHSSAPSLNGGRPKLPTLVSSPSLTPRLTASDVELGGRSPPARPRPTHQTSTQSPLLRRVY